MCTWLDLDNDDIEALTKPLSDLSPTFSQSIVISVYNIYQKVFESGTGTENITTNVYEIRSSPENAPVLKRIFIQGITTYQPPNSTIHPI